MSILALRRVSRLGSAQLVLCLMAALLFGGKDVRAQEQRATLVHQGVDLRVALLELREKTRIGLSYSPRLVAGKKSFCVAEDEVPEELLQCVLRDTGLDFIRRSSGTYVIQVAPEQAPLYGSIRGKVIDATSGEPIPDAHVWLPYKSVGRLSGRTGRFDIVDLEPGQYRVVVSYVGYRPEIAVVIVPPDGEVITEFKLQEEASVINEVVIEGLQAQERSLELGLAEVDPSAFESGGGGPTANTLRTLNALLGVRVNDVTSEVHVQGGETGEHQFRLDGAPVFMPLSLAGLVGPYSPAAIKRITVHKAGFGVSEGSQLAGVIEAEHDVSYTVPREWDVQVDPLSFNTRLSTPYGRDAEYPHSFMLAGRLGLGDLYMPNKVQSVLDGWNQLDTFILTAFSQEGSPFDQFLFNTNFSLSQTDVGFQDLHVANRLRFGPLRNLHSSLYFGGRTLTSRLTEQLDPTAEEADLLREAFAASDQEAPGVFDDAYDWQNGVAQTRFESVLGPRALTSVQFRGSFFDLDHTYQASDTSFVPQDDQNRVREYAAEATLDYAWADNQNLHVGLEVALTRTRFSVLGTQPQPIRHQSDNWRMALYGAHYVSLARWLTLELGTRATYVPARQTLYGEPRFSLRFDVPDTRLGTFAWRLGAGMYRQFVNQFDISSRSPLSLMPSNRVWLAVDSTVSPPLALHATADLLYQPRPAWTFRVEGFYKQQHHALTIDYAAPIPANVSHVDQRQFLSGTKGYTAGFAVALERQLGPGKVFTRYEYTEAERTVEGWFDGQTFGVPWQEPYRLEVGFDVALFQNFSLVARGQGIWGRTWGFRRAYYEYLGAYIPSYPENITTDPERARFVQDALVSELGLSNSRARGIANQVVRYNLLEPEAAEHELPTLLQLDLGLAYSTTLRNTSIQARFDAINVLNRDNVAEWQFVKTAAATSGFLERQPRYTLPFIPSFTVRVGW